MQITSTLNFIARPGPVADMLVDPDFAEHVGQEIKALNWTTSVIDEGLTAVFTVESPAKARMILGNQFTVTETVTWETDAGDGTRVGRMTLSVAGVPATADGPIRLAAAPTGSVMTYDADLNVRVPLFGKKIEQLATGYLTRIIAACEKVGNAWLNPPTPRRGLIEPLDD